MMVIYIIIGFVILFLLVKLWIVIRNKDLPKENGEFERGYNGAIECIDRGEDPAELRIEARSDITRDNFYRGWVKACEENL